MDAVDLEFDKNYYVVSYQPSIAYLELNSQYPCFEVAFRHLNPGAGFSLMASL